MKLSHTQMFAHFFLYMTKTFTITTGDGSSCLLPNPKRNKTEKCKTMHSCLTRSVHKFEIQDY